MTASPCTGICEMQPRHGLCRGCLRTLDEIAGWGRMTNAKRHAVLARIAYHRANHPVGDKLLETGAAGED